MKLLVPIMVMVLFCADTAAAQMMYNPNREHATDMQNIKRLEGPLIPKKIPLADRYKESRKQDYTKSKREKLKPGEIPSYEKNIDYFSEFRAQEQKAIGSAEQIKRIEEQSAQTNEQWKREMQRKAYAEAKLAEKTARENERKHMETALFSAIYAGDIATVREALVYGVNPNVMFKEYTPLHYAALLRKLDIIMLLLEQPGVNIGTKENQYYSLIFWGAYENHLDMMRKLLQKGASPDLTDDRGITPLRYAQSQKHSEMVSLLREYMKKPK